MPAIVRALRGVWFAGLTFVTVASGVAFVSWTAGGHGPPMFFLIVWFIVATSMWYWMLAVESIEARFWPDDGRLQFRSLLRTRELNASDVIDVDMGLRGLNQRVVIFGYRHGNRRKVARLPNLKPTWTLVHAIQESNQAVVVRRLPVDIWRPT